MNKGSRPPSDNTGFAVKLLSLGAQLNAIELVVGALVITHPKPAQFSAELRSALERATTQHLFDPLVTDEVRARYKATAESFISLANERTAPGD